MSAVGAERRWLLGLALMSALVVACYLVAMNAYWVGDDFNYVRPKSWAEVGNFFNPVGRAQFRPLTWSTWAAGFALFGTEPLGWHLARLAQHLWNAVWAALLVRAIIGRRDVALIAAMLFALHPAQPQTVTWLGGQADASFAMFWLPALCLFVRWRQGPGAGAGRGLWLLSGALGFVSMFGKEAAVTLPILALFIDLLYGRGWACWPGKRSPGWWRDPGTLLGLLRDHSLFLAAAGLYVGLRVVLFLTGQGRLMYGSDQLGFLTNWLDVAAGYIVLSLGFWWLPPGVTGWPLLLKLAILVVALLGLFLLARWLGRNAVFAVGWFAITLLLTLQAVALRWFYMPALGVGLLLALVYARLRDEGRTEDEGRRTKDDARTKDGANATSSVLRPSSFVLPILFLAWYGWQTIAHNVQWREAGEEARRILAQVQALHPDPPRPATFYVANPPYGYKDVLLFNTGLDSAIHHVYNDWTNIRSYSVGEDTAQVQAALSDPSRLGPNPIFLRYEAGRMIDYATLEALVEAGAR
jgi:hypothetical protein